ncbi:transposable element Tcb2 transposase [Trichonephila clavipes]|nr:transposable element Tcb2 transposase [Trichonephila clavipes]
MPAMIRYLDHQAAAAFGVKASMFTITRMSTGSVAQKVERSLCMRKPTSSSADIQANVALSLGPPLSSRILQRHLAERHLRSRCPLRVLPLTPTYRRLRLEWSHVHGIWTAEKWNQVVFSDEPRFNLRSYDNHVHVWRPRGERLNTAFALQ